MQKTPLTLVLTQPCIPDNVTTEAAFYSEEGNEARGRIEKKHAHRKLEEE